MRGVFGGSAWEVISGSLRDVLCGPERDIASGPARDIIGRSASPCPSMHRPVFGNPRKSVKVRGGPWISGRVHYFMYSEDLYWAVLTVGEDERIHQRKP